jgi:peptidyl-prolyl cis-trans isomerase SurA
MQTRTFGIMVAVAVLGTGAAQAQSVPDEAVPRLSSNVSGALVVERILVKVNGDLVTQTDLEEAQIAGIQGLPNPPQTDAELRRVMREMTPELFANTVDNMLLEQRGREMGFSLSDDQFNEVVDGIMVENGFEDDEELEEALAQTDGMTMLTLRDVLEKQMLIQQVRNAEVNSRIVMTGTEAREYYDDHLEEFTTPATVTLREIVVATPEGTGPLATAGAERAAATAEAAHSRVLGGEDFALVASEVSTAASNANGGQIGPINLTDLAEAVRARVEQLAVGDVGAVEQTAAGYQILKLEAMTPAAPMEFDEIRASIVNSVAESRQDKELNDYLADLREAAIIEWKDDALRQVYEAFVAARAAASGL